MIKVEHWEGSFTEIGNYANELEKEGNLLLSLQIMECYKGSYTPFKHQWIAVYRMKEDVAQST